MHANAKHCIRILQQSPVAITSLHHERRPVRPMSFGDVDYLVMTSSFRQLRRATRHCLMWCKYYLQLVDHVDHNHMINSLYIRYTRAMTSNTNEPASQRGPFCILRCDQSKRRCSLLCLYSRWFCCQLAFPQTHWLSFHLTKKEYFLI